MGTKACRHYCCGGTCKGNLSNGSATFCDVQTLADVSQKAPVCMPLKRCNKLLGVSECGATETCTVVTEGGDTGCVVVGDKQVGDSCDDAHCGAKLAYSCAHEATNDHTETETQSHRRDTAHPPQPV